MSKSRPIRTKRFWPRFRRSKRKIPASRVAGRKDWYPSFQTSICGSTDLTDSGAGKGGAIRTSTTTQSQVTNFIELVPREQVQRYDDHVKAVRVVGSLWWYTFENEDLPPLTCEETARTTWGVWSILKYHRRGNEVDFSSDQRKYNFWDLGVGTGVTGTTGPEALDRLYAEGDFTAPEERILWQKHTVYDREEMCYRGRIASDDAQWNGVMNPKMVRVDINARINTTLRGNEMLVFQQDFCDPFQSNCSDVYGEEIWQFGFLKTLLELA